jgi:ubiquinone/menaquinone biosynthesis C-methylase UbiE
MNVQDAYNQWSSTYDSDRNLTRDLDQRVTQEMLAGHPVNLTLEIGCGTGKNTQFLAAVSRRVIGLDFSSGMLRLAREKVRSDWACLCTADLQQAWPIKSGTVDRAVCNLVLEHIAGLDFIFSEAQRVLRPGADFLISELHPFRQYQGTKANFNDGVGQVEIRAFVHSISDFTRAGFSNGFQLTDLHEWWDSEDQKKLPRLVTFIFHKPSW